MENISSDKIFRHLYIMVEGFCLVLNYSSEGFVFPNIIVHSELTRSLLSSIKAEWFGVAYIAQP